ncbi:transposase [Kitasatospora kazusensis]|uniref:Transposase n=1 Tax=Kitasatospora kazusensis TaxID=407974 RepID=A0ABP5KNH7_9ACTN
MSAGLVRPGHPLPTDALGDLGDSLGTLCDLVLASMQRSDQRAKGELYARGLLLTEGTKSMRNIALHLGPEARGQSMHHFISSSTWDWRPVREALARHLERVLAPPAWVLRPMVVRKDGEHSVGVTRRVDPDSGRIVNSQRAYGLWAASRQLSVPFNWSLHLPADWLEDRVRRNRAKIPERWGTITPGQCAGRVLTEVLDGWGLTARPVVLELGSEESAAVMTACSATGVPFLARIPGGTPLSGADPTLPDRSGQEITAQQLLGGVAARTLRRPVQWWDPVEETARTTLAAAVQVRLPRGRGPDRPPARPRPATLPGPYRPSRPGPQPGSPRTLTLLGEWSDIRSWPTEFWLTDLTGPPGRLLRLAKLARRVDRDFAEVGEQVGLAEFKGRSFEGWHRHATLASVAHAVRALAATAGAYALEPSA